MHAPATDAATVYFYKYTRWPIRLCKCSIVTRPSRYGGNFLCGLLLEVAVKDTLLVDVAGIRK